MTHARRVEIYWVDSASWKAVWDNVFDVVGHYKEYGQDRIKTIGYLIERTKDYVIVARDLQFNGDKTVSRAGGFFSIPTGCIKKIKYLSGPVLYE